MEDCDNYSEDQLDNLSDDKLWDILDNFSNDKEDSGNKLKSSIKQVSDKYNQCCSACNSTDIIFTSGRGSFVCGNCGTESREVLDESPEWNNYEDGKADNGRCGAPINAFFPKSSLGTTINAPGYSKVKMLRNWGQVPYRERSLAEVLNDIDSKCKKYKITKAVIDNAKILYKNIRETKHTSGDNKGKNVIIRGVNRKQIIAACFYFGAVLQKAPRSIKEVADVFNLELKQVTKGCRKFLETMKDNFIIFDIKPSHGTDFIERFGSKIKLSKESIDLAKTISENTTRIDIASDHQATSIAAASILLAANILEQNINKKTISEVFDISDVTITKTYKKIYPYQKIVVSDELTNKICHKMNIKFMTEGFDNLEVDEIEADTETLSDVDTETSDDINSNQLESETEILIKKLNQQYQTEPINTTKPNNIDLISNLQTFIPNINNQNNLDESDVVKKDNTQSKKNKLLLIQKEKEKRKEEKIKAKEEKIKAKQIEKEKLKMNKKLNKNIDFNNLANQYSKLLVSNKLITLNAETNDNSKDDIFIENNLVLNNIMSSNLISITDVKKKRGRPKKSTTNTTTTNTTSQSLNV
jgi:transcription initiation factor TFIIB